LAYIEQKSKISGKFLLCSQYTGGPMIGPKARTGSASFFLAGIAPTKFGSGSCFGSDPYPLAYGILKCKKQKFGISF
jgi:hypothetical protein